MYWTGSLLGRVLPMMAIDSASALATVTRASASPCARISFASFSPSASRIAACFLPSAFSTAEALAPSASKMRARRSRSARICFSMAWRMSRGGVTSWSSTRLTLTPHLSVAPSSVSRSLALIKSREMSVSSRSMEPMTSRSLVWVSFSIASGRLLIS